jgi:hypothetical protein
MTVTFPSLRMSQPDVRLQHRNQRTIVWTSDQPEPANAGVVTCQIQVLMFSSQGSSGFGSGPKSISMTSWSFSYL